MTLVIAAPGNDFIVLGADSRGVIDSGEARVEINILTKLFPITQNAAIMMYGGSEDASQLVEKYRSIYKQRKMNLNGVTLVAEDFCEFCRKEEIKLAKVPKHPKSFEYFGFIICGLNIVDDKIQPMIYVTTNFNGFRLGLCRPYAIEGKPIIAHYHFAKNFKENMNVNDLCRIVAQSIYDTMRIDGDVGGEIRIAIIDSKGFREISESDVKELYETWEISALREIMQ